MKTIFRPVYQLLLKIFSLKIILLYQLTNMLPRGRYVTSLALDRIFGKTTEIQISDELLVFHTPNWLTYHRAKSLQTKEPETILWIDSMPKNSVLWDIGANIGTFTIYASKKEIEVVAVEPSFLNIELLHRNIISNKVNQKVTIIPLGVGSITRQQELFLSDKQLTWGGAHNSLGVNVGFDGKPLKNPISIKSFGFSIDDLVKTYSFRAPHYLKIDVDGLESEVLKGALITLAKVHSVLVEVDRDHLTQQSEVKEILLKCDFELQFETKGGQGTTNQIWKKLYSGDIA